MMELILGGLFATAIIDLILAALVLGSTREPHQKISLAAMLATTGLWSLGVGAFLHASDEKVALFWADIYYVMAALIVPATFWFATVFPKKIRVSPVLIGLLSLAPLAIFAVILAGDGLIEKIVIVPGALNSVVFSSAHYVIYVLYYVVGGIGVTAMLLKGLRFAQKQPRTSTLARQMQLIVISLVVALGAGMWFNLILPLLGDYGYIWCGPLLTLIFTVTLMYVVVRQGLFDLRQALVRTAGYLALVAIMIATAATIFWLAEAITQYFAITRLPLEIIAFITVAVLALLAPPLKKIVDRRADRILSFGSYDSDTVLDELRWIARDETDAQIIAQKSLAVLISALGASYATAYIRGHNGEWWQLQEGRSVTPHAIATQAAILERHIDQLPMTGRVNDVDQLRCPVAYSLLAKSNVGAFMRLESHKASIGMLFFGEKIDHKLYSAQDMRLLGIAASDLSLAIENSLRFLEIEQFTQTLEQKVAAATKELKKSNTELQRLDTTKDEFLSMASHQLRTPLTSVKGYIDMVLEGDAGDITDMQHQLLAQAFDSSERMVHLIDDFLNVSRLQTGKFMIDRQLTDVAKLVTQEVKSLDTTATSHGLRLRTRIAKTVPQLYVDDNKIRQVIMNFIDNAIYYSKPSSTIEIKLYTDHGDLVFEVHDSGIGVPKSEQKHLFTKFFRAENARKQRPDGTGIGLYLAKKVIDGHMGRIVFESTPGKGSVFGFRLPIARLKDAEQSLDEKTERR